MAEVTLLTNGKEFRGWTSVAYDRSIESLVTSFNCSFVSGSRDANSAQRDIIDGDKCLVRYDDQDEFEGYVEETDSSFDASSAALSVSGRSLHSGLVDCSVEPPKQFLNQKLSSIATTICEPFGLLVSVDDDAEKIPYFVIEPGENAFDALSRLADLRRMILFGDSSNGVLFTRAGSGGDAGENLEFGVNIKAGSRQCSVANRFSRYIVRSSAKGMGAGNVAAKGMADDGDVKLYRPISVGVQNRSASQCKKRAEWERNVRWGKAATFSYTVVGWRNKKRSWTINTTTSVTCPRHGLNNEQLLITKTAKRYDVNSGATTVLTLMRPAAFDVDPLPPKVSKKDGW